MEHLVFLKIYLIITFLATGEPPICMSSSVFFALRNAVDAARKDAGESPWYQMGALNLTFFKDLKKILNLCVKFDRWTSYDRQTAPKDGSQT